MAQTIIPNDLQVQGALTCKTFVPPAPSITPGAVIGAPGNYQQATNFQQQHQKEYEQPSAQSAAVETKVIHVTRGLTGVVMDVAFGAVVAAVGAATVVFDLLKNGASILTAQVTLDGTTPAYTLKAGTLSATTTAAGDVFELKVASAAAGGGTLAKGLFARLTIREDPN